MRLELGTPAAVLLMTLGCPEARTDSDVDACGRADCAIEPEHTPLPLPREREWACRTTSPPECSCNASGFITAGPIASLQGSCHAYDCCVLEDTGAPSEAQCVCRDDVDCAAELATQPGGVRVDQCPPAAEDPRLITCAALNEDCSPESREQRGLAGCCDGSLCGLDGAAQLVCQVASPVERDLAAECRKVAMSSVGDDLRSSGGVSTGMGWLEFPTVSTVIAELGPRGCINRVDVRVEAKPFCNLRLTVEALGGTPRVTGISSNWSACWSDAGVGSSGVPSPNMSNPSAVTVSFTGVACIRAPQNHCVTGTFDFHFLGQIGSLTFEDSHLLLEGTLCPGQEADSCMADAPRNAG